MVTYSRAPVYASGSFYPDSRKRDASYPPLRGNIDGNNVYIHLKEPKLCPPAMLSVSVLGEKDIEDEIAVERVEHQVPARQI